LGRNWRFICRRLFLGDYAFHGGTWEASLAERADLITASATAPVALLRLAARSDVYEAILVGISKACFAEFSAKLFDEGASD
jgi:hypothetical protein